jgi:peptidoglycan hydrolase-like protein with peptidoglycan-binding domain
LWGVGSDKLAPAHHTPHYHDDPGDIMAKLPLVKRGDNSRHVRDVQGLCNSHWENITIDGDFGPATEAAVKTVQRRYKVAADGVVGPVTWTCLLRVT